MTQHPPPPIQNVTYTPQRLVPNAHHGRIAIIQHLSTTPNTAAGVFQAGCTDSFSRAHFMLGKRQYSCLQSLNYCLCCLITKGSKVGKPNSAACNRSLTAHEQRQQIPDGRIQLRQQPTHQTCVTERKKITFLFSLQMFGFLKLRNRPAALKLPKAVIRSEASKEAFMQILTLKPGARHKGPKIHAVREHNRNASPTEKTHCKALHSAPPQHSLHTEQLL